MELKTTNKYKAEVTLKHKIIAMRIVFYTLLVSGFFLFIIGCIMNFNEKTMLLGVIALVLCIFSRVVMGKGVKELETLIEKYCPKCDNPTLVFVKTTSEKIGVRKSNTVTSPANFYVRDLMLETNYFKCENCGAETQRTKTYENPDL